MSLGPLLILTPVLLLITFGLLVATFVGQLIAGPARWVRICSVLLVAAATLDLAVLVSPRSALVLLIFIVGITVLGSIAALLSWSEPLRKALAPHPFDPPDKLLRDRAAAWTAEAPQAGFEQAGEYQGTWSFAGQPRRVWVRLFRHAGARCWAEVHVLVKPKVAALRIVSLLEDGRIVETSNRRSNSAVLGDAKTLFVKTPESATLVRALAAHETRLAAAGSSPGAVQQDPRELTEQLHLQWGERMVRAGKLVVRGELLKVAPTAAAGIALRSLGDLFRG